MSDDNNTKEVTPKDELRQKFANTFKLFDDEGPTVPVEITNVGKLNFNIEDLNPDKPANKEIHSNKSSENDVVLPDIEKFDIHEEETRPVEVTNVGKLKFNIKDLEPDTNFTHTKTQNIASQQSIAESHQPEYKKDSTVSDKFDNLSFTMNSRLESEQRKDEKNNSETTRHYKVLKFFARITSTILDQIVILGLTYLYFLFLIKPNMIKTPYQYIEAVADFIINDSSNFKSLLIGYLLITIIYYTVSNIIIKSTPFNYLFGYKIYRNNSLASPLILISRNILMVILNLFLLFPYLFMLVSDDRQTIYDKIFKTYFLKEN